MYFDLPLRRCCIGFDGSCVSVELQKGKGVLEDGIYSQSWPSLGHDVCLG